MPIYEYRCDNCAHEFETIQKVSDAPLTTCPACSRETLRKKVSAAGFRLKGGGWYETDFKAKNKKNVAGEDKSAAKDGDKGGGGKSADSGDSGKSSSDGGKVDGGKSGADTKGAGSPKAKASE